MKIRIFDHEYKYEYKNDPEHDMRSFKVQEKVHLKKHIGFPEKMC